MRRRARHAFPAAPPPAGRCAPVSPLAGEVAPDADAAIIVEAVQHGGKQIDVLLALNLRHRFKQAAGHGVQAFDAACQVRGPVLFCLGDRLGAIHHQDGQQRMALEDGERLRSARATDVDDAREAAAVEIGGEGVAGQRCRWRPFTIRDNACGPGARGVASTRSRVSRSCRRHRRAVHRPIAHVQRQLRQSAIDRIEVRPLRRQAGEHAGVGGDRIARLLPMRVTDHRKYHAQQPRDRAPPMPCRSS